MENTNKTNDFTANIANVVIDKVLCDTTSIMYNRQAAYLYLLKLNGYTVSNLRKTITARAKILGIYINRGVLVRESDVANICLTDKNALFAKFKVSKANPAESIARLAKIMQNNKLSYTYLQKEGYFKKKEKQADSAESAENGENGENGESTESKVVQNSPTLKSVLKFIDGVNDAKTLDTISKAILARGKQLTPKAQKKAA